MEISHNKPKKESWTVEIQPYRHREKYLVEDAPLDENTRAIYQLKEPLRDWLKTHKHRMEIDRGDFGEGSEHFQITLYSKADLDDFRALCETFR